MKRKQVYYNQDTSKLQEQKAYGEFQDIPSTSEESGIKNYIAQVAQIAANQAPVVSVVFENTIGAITFSRVGVGEYKALGTFPFGKTVCPPFPVGSNGALIPLYLNNPGDTLYRITRAIDNELNIEFLNSAGSFTEWADTGSEIILQIIVYP